MRLPRDVVTGAVLLLVAVVYGFHAGDFPEGRSGDPGPALFPYLLAFGLGGLSLWIILRALLESWRDRAAGAPPADTGGIAAYFGLIRVLVAIALTLGFVASFTALGYVIATAIYSGALSLLFRRDSLLIPVLSVVLAVGCLHLLFVVLLNVRLPAGLLG